MAEIGKCYLIFHANAKLHAKTLSYPISISLMRVSSFEGSAKKNSGFKVRVSYLTLKANLKKNFLSQSNQCAALKTLCQVYENNYFCFGINNFLITCHRKNISIIYPVLFYNINIHVDDYRMLRTWRMGAESFAQNSFL